MKPKQSSAALAALSAARSTRRLAERLGPSKTSRPRDANGAIVIQIDGLSHEVLSKALKLRIMPSLRKLLRKKNYVLKRFRVGLPATTPAFQAKAFYGVSDTVPGFAWFDRQALKVRTMKNPADAREVEAYMTHAKGALEGGSVYGAFFCGGASTCTFTVSATEPGKLVSSLPTWDLFVFLVANSLAFLRISASAIWEFILEVWDHMLAVLSGRPRRSELGFIIERVIANAVMREITTVATCLDIHRGVPIIWANFPGYDALAHHRGPRSFRALWTLRGIDRAVKTIARAAGISRARSYDLYVLSDHGQLRTTPFSRIHRMSLRDWLVRQLGRTGSRQVQHPPRDDHDTRQDPALATAQLLSLIRHVRDALPGILRGLARTIEKRLARRLRKATRNSPRAEIADSTQALLGAAEAYMLGTGDIAHVYLKPSAQPMEFTEIEAEFPGLIGSILQLSGVRAVAVRSGTDVLLKGRNGSILLGRSPDRVRLEGQSPLSHLPEELASILDVEKLLAMRDSGDIVIFAGSLPEAVPAGPDEDLRRRRKSYLGFLDQLGSHGGLEPAEQYAFIIGPAEKSGALERINAPEDLYEFLRRYSGAGQ